LPVREEDRASFAYSAPVAAPMTPALPGFGGGNGNAVPMTPARPAGFGGTAAPSTPASILAGRQMVTGGAPQTPAMIVNSRSAPRFAPQTPAGIVNRVGIAGTNAPGTPVGLVTPKALSVAMTPGLAPPAISTPAATGRLSGPAAATPSVAAGLAQREADKNEIVARKQAELEATAMMERKTREEEDARRRAKAPIQTLMTAAKTKEIAEKSLTPGLTDYEEPSNWTEGNNGLTSKSDFNDFIAQRNKTNAGASDEAEFKQER